jgi:hypothetical protein
MVAFSPSNANLKVWLREEPTDPAHTKPITGKAFKGTALSGGYVAKRLTAAFGPVGLGWGYTPTFEDVHFPSGDSLNFCTLDFWYYPNGCDIVDGLLQPRGPRAAFTQVGGTALSGTYSSGKHYADDEARKKSITDAMLKAASHLGRYDDSKYMATRTADAAAERASVERETAQVEREETLREAQTCMDELTAAATPGEFETAVEMVKAIFGDLKRIDPMKAELLTKAVKDTAARLNIAPKKDAA